MSDNPIDGHAMVFRAAASNAGTVTIQRGKRFVTIKKDGRPVKAGDITPGQTVCVNKDTGEIEDL